MHSHYDRRNFLLKAGVAGLGLSLTAVTGCKTQKGVIAPVASTSVADTGKRIGIIGLDTSHSTAFTEALNKQQANRNYLGYRIVAAYPYGSHDIQSSAERIPGYIADVKKYGVQIVDSIEALLADSDVVMLETNDGTLHVEQAMKVLQAGKKMFIDKPVAASLKDAQAIYAAAKNAGVPIFSSSSLRFTAATQEVASGKKIGRVSGADTYSPCDIEKSHADLFWYGIHGVEALFTVMGKDCKEVRRIHTEDADVVTGLWDGNRIGTFRGMRNGKTGYGGIAFGESGTAAIGMYEGYEVLLKKIIDFFETGLTPVSAEETIAIYTFMEAADESKRNGGSVVKISV